LPEQRCMPVRAPRRPRPIPAPERTGVPALGYPYSWSVVPLIPGIPAVSGLGELAGLAGGGAAELAELAVPTESTVLAELAVLAESTVPDALDWADVAVSLARFLGALHVPAPADAPQNPLRG